MMPTIQIIGHDVDDTKELKRILEAEGYEVLSTVSGQAGIALAEINRPKLILLDTDLPDIDGYEVCRALRGSTYTAKAAILMYSTRAEVADKVAGLEAGANDYIVKPAAPAELLARIKAALRSEERPLAYIVALWGSKGGVGTTAIASNLSVALRSKTGKRVILMDACMLGGTLEVLLNLPPRRTIADVLPHLDDLDTELLGSVLTKHSSGIRVLLSAPWSSDGETVQPTQFELILAWLQPACDYIVLDTSPAMDDSTLAVLQLADQVILVLTPEMTALRNARLFLSMAETFGPESQELTVALNRYPLKGGIKLKEIEAALRTKVGVQIPRDDALVTYSINRGIPLVTSHPRSPVAKGFFRLADAVIATAKKKQRVAVISTVLSRRS
jgi:pilus assembly protein CpaE